MNIGLQSKRHLFDDVTEASWASYESCISGSASQSSSVKTSMNLSLHHNAQSFPTIRCATMLYDFVSRCYWCFQTSTVSTKCWPCSGRGMSHWGLFLWAQETSCGGKETLAAGQGQKNKRWSISLSDKGVIYNFIFQTQTRTAQPLLVIIKKKDLCPWDETVELN